MSGTRSVAPAERETLLSCLSNSSLHLVLLPTEACNFRCLYCYESFQAGRMEPWVVRGIKEFLTRRVPTLRDLTISWFGGEPLVARDLIEDVMARVAALAAEHPNLRVASDATTNGYLLTPGAADRLIGLGVTDYQITFDPPRERHDRWRVLKTGRGTFARIFKNVLALRESERDFTVTIRIHVDRENVHAIPPFLEECASSFGTDPRFVVFLRALSRLGGPNDACLPVFEEGEGESTLGVLRGRARDLGLRVQGAESERTICYAAKANSFVVRADGRLNKCTVALDHPNNQVGRIFENGTIHVDSAKLGSWMRGVWTGNSSERSCPMMGYADPATARGRPLAAPLVSLFLAVLLVGGAAAAPRGSPGPTARAVTTAQAVNAARAAEADTAATGRFRRALDDIRHMNRVGRTAEAERAARALLADVDRRQGPESLDAAEVLDELAVALRLLGKYEEPEALQVCERAVRTKQAAYGRNDPRVAASLHNLGMLHYVRGEYARARAVLEEALAIRERTLGRNDERIAKTLLALGAVRFDLGAYEEALPFAEQAVAIEELALAPDDPERTHGLHSLATLRYELGDIAGAIPLLEEVIRLQEQAPDPNQAMIADFKSTLGATYREIGDYPRAIDILERARGIREGESGARRVYLAGTLSILSDAYEDAGDIPRARALIERAVQIYDSLDADSPNLGRALTNLGWLHFNEGAIDRAREEFERGLRVQEAAPGGEQGCVWYTLHGLAVVASRQGEREAARRYFERAVDHVRATYGPMHPELGSTLGAFASFRLDSGDSLGAFDMALQAAEINREHLRVTLAGMAERQALTLISKIETGLDVALAAIAGTDLGDSEVLVRRVWDSEVRSRGLVLDEFGRRARLVEGVGDFLEAAKRLGAANARLANLLVRGSLLGDPGRERQRIARARAEVEECERRLAARSAPFRADVDRASVGLDGVLSYLPKGTALVSYVCYGRSTARSYLAFVTGADRRVRAVPLGGADEIDRTIAAWRVLAGTPPADDPAAAERACRKAGHAVRERIWDPFAPLLAGSRLVFVVPEGPIHLLSLAALPSRDAGYLVESLPMIHYVSIERDIVRGGRVHTHGAGLLAVGNPAFDLAERSAFADSGSSGVVEMPPSNTRSPAPYRELPTGGADFRSLRFTELPETDREVDEIAKAWGWVRGGVIVLKGDAAGERSVKDLLPGRRVAHIATHGFFLPAARDTFVAARAGAGAGGARGIGGVGPAKAAPPKKGDGAGTPGATAEGDTPPVNPFHLSGLALAAANLRANAGPEDEDGILVAEEIASLDLSALDWVVLSACQTGIGDVRTGEGVLGFRRAFELAGAGTLIMSLWMVGDQSTRDWMGRLYDGRLRGQLETAEAVREADLGALKSLRAKKRCTHPFYWAGFIAVGDWK
jgi:sulfatase maturation enzyme AslB (radical SAM superfamily)/CHAT domain-containing protein/tetratricopeptide (TPR) repeat protein